MGQPGKQGDFTAGLLVGQKMRIATLVSWIRSSRSLRGQFFDEELFGEPAWDILLDLYDAELKQIRVKVTGVSVGSRLPATTALRWLKALETRGFIGRCADPTDGRRVFISLTPFAIGVMDVLFEKILEQLPELHSST